MQDVPEDLGIHHIVVNTWEGGVDGPQNIVLISVPSVLDPSLAPPGKHVLHAYTPGQRSQLTISVSVSVSVSRFTFPFHVCSSLPHSW